jgi:hypothetical protein
MELVGKVLSHSADLPSRLMMGSAVSARLIMAAKNLTGATAIRRGATLPAPVT